MTRTPYHLTLTHEERQAIDSKNNLYEHGDDLHRFLLMGTTDPQDAAWDSTDTIIFAVSEHVARKIARIVDSGVHYFEPPLVRKFQELSDAIV
jgi:hypothetical protein